MSKLQFDVTAEKSGILIDAMKLVFAALELLGTYPRGGRRGVTHYAVRAETPGVELPSGGWEYGRQPRPHRLVFFNHYEPKQEDGDKVAFPFVMDADGAADFARRWLEQVEYGKQPDHDGDNEKGWRLYNENWGHIDGDNHAVIAVTPVWATYGK
jgi:hypothetical protein